MVVMMMAVADLPDLPPGLLIISSSILLIIQAGHICVSIIQSITLVGEPTVKVRY